MPSYLHLHIFPFLGRHAEIAHEVVADQPGPVLQPTGLSNFGLIGGYEDY